MLLLLLLRLRLLLLWAPQQQEVVGHRSGPLVWKNWAGSWCVWLVG